MDSIFDAVADGLAENGFAVVDDFLTPGEVNEICLLEEFKNNINQFKKASIGKKQGNQVNESIRGDYIHWLDKNNASAAVLVYMHRLNQLMQFLNQGLFLSLKGYEIHLTVYPVGSFYKRHLDQFKADDHRKLSVICYLNNQWTEQHGGQLKMHLPGGPVDVLPLAGRLVCFRSDQVEHEVLPATRERLSLTGWMLDRLVE